MITDKEFADKVHLLIHSARLIPNYKATEIEKKLSSYVIEKYSDSCSECKVAGERIKYSQPKSGFLDKLKGALG